LHDRSTKFFNTFSDVREIHHTFFSCHFLHAGELGSDFSPDMKIQELKKKEIHQLTQLLREAKFSAPDPACLSPAGEYNLRLGIMKELQPDLVATASIP
jgi:DNA topoisomerase-6 subunit B